MARLVEPSEDDRRFRAAELSDEEFRKLTESQLEDTRKSAEGWRNGLAALIGLTAIASTINSGAVVSNLGAGAAVGAGTLLLIGIAAAAWGIVRSMRAAYGSPDLIERSEFAAGGGLDGFRFQLAVQAARDLKFARYASLVALASVVAAIGIVWYGPRAQEPFVQIETTGLTHLCGRIVGSADGHVELQDPAGSAIIVDTKAIQAIRTVGHC